MRINNNLIAANTTRRLGINATASAKSMEKLSSGYRINKAGDDAAGLAISEKMRGQIRGLNQASKNAQDGISLLQTADGALGETHAVLQRMRELAVQAASGTFQDEDREQIQKEFTALRAEVQDIAEKTQFNKMTLLDGSLGRTAGGTAVAVDGVSLVSLSGTAAGTYTITDAGTDLVITDGDGNAATIAGGSMAGGAQIVNVKQFGITISTNADFVAASLNGLDIVVAGSGIQIQTGANQGDELEIAIGDMNVSGLGVDTAAIDSASAAQSAITTLEDAIKLVSDERALIGATQNRLEYKINNLDSTAENLQSAESKIRDVDMAVEIVEYTKNDILQQAAQAMLAKANLAPQNVLQLLR